MRSIALTLFSLFLGLLSWQSYGQRTYSNEFLNIGVGAKSLSMGNASIAQISDVTAGYWNPAGLAFQKNKLEVGLMHNENFLGVVNYDYAGLSYRLTENRVLGLSVIRSGIDDIQNTLEIFDADGNLDLNKIKYFSVADYGILLSLAEKRNDQFSYGGNVKIIRRVVGEFASSWGFGFDLGMQYQHKGWNFGVVAKDVTSTFNAWSLDSEALEITVLDSTFNLTDESAIEITLPQLIGGIGRNFPIKEDFNLYAELNARFTFDGQRNTLVSSKVINIDPVLGLELSYKNSLFARAGVNNYQVVPDFENEHVSVQPNIGLGIKLKRWTIDYAMTNLGNSNAFEFSNVFSLSFRM